MSKKVRKPPVTVLDTNILISYLFGSKTITLLIDSLENDSFIPAISPYPKFDKSQKFSFKK